MSKFDDCITTYTAALEKLGETVDADLLHKIAKGLGPSIYNTDASLVSSSDDEEIGRVKKNFLIKKLGMTDDDAIDAAISAVVDWYGSSTRNKYRAVFYYKLVLNLDKADIYA